MAWYAEYKRVMRGSWDTRYRYTYFHNWVWQYKHDNCPKRSVKETMMVYGMMCAILGQNPYSTYI